LGKLDLDECVSCGAGLISVSDICPQCGWPKNKPIKPDEPEEKVEKDIENNPSAKKPSVIKNKIFRPAGVRLISVSYMLFGISLILFGLIFVSAVMFLVMSDAMGELGGIGGGMGNMPMLPGMGGIDASTKSSLDKIIDLNRIAGSPSASEIEMRMNSSGIMNIDLMMEIIGEAGVIALIEIIIGLGIFGIGLVLFKGKKLARPAIIVSSIISIPLVVSFVTVDILVLLGMAAFNGVVLYYMLKSKAREYFNQTSTKKPKIKKSKIKKLDSSESEISESEIKELERPWYIPPDKEVNVRRMIIYSFLPFVVIYAAWRIKKFWVLFALSIVFMFAAPSILSFGLSLVLPIWYMPFSWVLDIILQVYIIKHYARKYNENLLKLNA